MAWLPYAYWPAAVLLMAWLQGWLLPAIRRTPPGAEAGRQSFALHWVGSAAYYLPWLLTPTLPLLACAAIARLALFDPLLNAFSSRAMFYVGQTAATDKLLRKVAGGRAEALSAVLRLVAVGALGLGFWYYMRR